MKGVSVAVALLTLCVGLQGQDTRVVREPRIPPVCKILKAHLTRIGGADGIAFADEFRADTQRIQNSINQCAAGQAVELAPDGKHGAFLTAPIQLRPGVTLLIDKGVTLYGSRNPRDYDITPGGCGVINNSIRRACRALIWGDNAPNAGIMGDGVIEERGGAKLIIDGMVQKESWWDMSRRSKAGGHKHNPRIIYVDHCDNFTLYRITLRNSASSHAAYADGNGFTVWGVKLDTPKDAINADGIVPYASKNITITHSFIRVGDDNIVLKADGNGPVTNVTIVHNHFYYGHGMSIGSGTMPEVRAIRVTDLSLDGTQLAGIRIKSAISNGGLVHDVVYDDICIRNSERPIQLLTHYTDFPGPATNHLPVFNDITFRNVRISGGGKIMLDGLDARHRIGVRFDGVTVDNPEAYKFYIRHADITLGPGPVNFKPSGEDTVVKGDPGYGVLPSCKDKFVPFPAD